MISKNKTNRLAKRKLIFAFQVFVLSLAFANLCNVTADSQENTVPKGWMFNTNQSMFKVGIDNVISQHEKNSATIESNVENPPDFCTLMQTCVVKDFSGKRLKMTGFIKSQGSDVKGSMWIRVDDYGNKIFADFDNMMDRPVTGNTDWTKCEIVFDVPEKCVLSYGFIMVGTGKIWVDNVSFETVPNSVDKTAHSLDQPFPDEYLNQLKEIPKELPDNPPVNLDFEEILIDKVINVIPTDLPKADLHIHLTRNYGTSPSVRYKRAAALSAKMGVTFGIAEEIGTPNVKYNDSLLAECIKEIKKYPLYLGLQVNHPGWTKLYSKETIDKIDYIIGDALMFPDKNGQVRLLWTPGVTFDDPQDFMDRYVEYNLKVLSEPVNVWVNPTFLPESLSGMYDKLWTEDRMKILIAAAVKNNVAIEINSRYQIPGKKFIQMAKAAGAHFTFGSNQHDTGIGDINWSITTATECGLKTQDFYTPKRKL
jgi:histidinol phosphatase-like PHP family hydrolase